VLKKLKAICLLNSDSFVLLTTNPVSEKVEVGLNPCPASIITLFGIFTLALGQEI